MSFVFSISSSSHFSFKNLPLHSIHIIITNFPPSFLQPFLHHHRLFITFSSASFLPSNTSFHNHHLTSSSLPTLSIFTSLSHFIITINKNIIILHIINIIIRQQPPLIFSNLPSPNTKLSHSYKLLQTSIHPLLQLKQPLHTFSSNNNPLLLPFKHPTFLRKIINSHH